MGFGDIVSMAGRSRRWLIVDVHPGNRYTIACEHNERRISAKSLVLIEKAYR